MSKIVGFFVLFLSLHTQADSVSLHLFSSPLGINWSTPWQMTVSTLKNSLVNTGDKRAFSISHVFVELNCNSSGEHIFRGQTSIENSGERELIFKKGYAMGVMFHTYEGQYETEQAVYSGIADYDGTSRYGTFTAVINAKTCQRLLRYEREYVARGYGKLYSGLQADPLKGEGAGCSAYGMSYLRVGGLMENFTNEWKNIIDVPKRFVGGPLTGKKVHITKLLFRPGAKWSNKEPHIHLEAWNPEKMLSWVKKTYDHLEKGGELEGYKTSIRKNGKSKHVTVDLSERSTPTGAIWLL